MSDILVADYHVTAQSGKCVRVTVRGPSWDHMDNLIVVWAHDVWCPPWDRVHEIVRPAVADMIIDDTMPSMASRSGAIIHHCDVCGCPRNVVVDDVRLQNVLSTL